MNQRMRLMRELPTTEFAAVNPYQRSAIKGKMESFVRGRQRFKDAHAILEEPDCVPSPEGLPGHLGPDLHL
jgi:hypothetical protein